MKFLAVLAVVISFLPLIILCFAAFPFIGMPESEEEKDANEPL